MFLGGEMPTRAGLKLTVVALVATTLVLAACGGRAEDSSGAAAGAKEDVDLLLAYLHDMVAVQYYFAKDFGYFDQCGIDVNYKTAAEVENPAQLVVAKTVDYAIIDPLTYISSRHRGLPIVAIAQDTARTGVAYVSLEKTGIDDPEDLPGHNVGVNPGGDNLWFLQKIMQDHLTAEQVEQVNIVPAGFSIQPLMTGSIDVYTAWITDSSLNSLMAEGQDFNLIRAFDYGIKTMGNVIVTHEETLEENPDQVRHFLAAVSAGLEDVVPANRDKAVDSALKRIEDDISPEVERSIFDSLLELLQDPVWDERGVGWHSPDAYAQTQDFLLENGEISEALPVEELYTEEVLEQVFKDGQVDLQSACSQQ